MKPPSRPPVSTASQKMKSCSSPGVMCSIACPPRMPPARPQRIAQSLLR
ncbi:MAG TPA: hypothetical protein VJC16_07865 [Candidatus Nanoarchaeia archaeon]|nr:hypothetical protein [Candidatus Nanoarchaeia archaeon]